MEIIFPKHIHHCVILCGNTQFVIWHLPGLFVSLHGYVRKRAFDDRLIKDIIDDVIKTSDNMV